MLGCAKSRKLNGIKPEVQGSREKGRTESICITALLQVLLSLCGDPKVGCSDHVFKLAWDKRISLGIRYLARKLDQP